MRIFNKDGLFNKGWRPLMGWSIVAGFVVQMVVKPLVSTLWPIESWSDALLTAAVSIFVALAGLRTYERQQGKVEESK